MWWRGRRTRRRQRPVRVSGGGDCGVLHLREICRGARTGLLEVGIYLLGGRRRRLVMGLTVRLMLLRRGVRDYVVLLLLLLLMVSQGTVMMRSVRDIVPRSPRCCRSRSRSGSRRCCRRDRGRRASRRRQRRQGRRRLQGRRRRRQGRRCCRRRTFHHNHLCTDSVAIALD